MTVLTNKRFSLPVELDERRLDKLDNARAAAGSFDVHQRDGVRVKRKSAVPHTLL